MEWLSDTNISAQQTDVFRRCQGTCPWLLYSDEFRKWLGSAEPVLFCPGIPEAGKTFLTSVVVNEGRFGQNPNFGIAHIYCSYKRQAEQTIENRVSSLLEQFIQRQPSLHTEVKSLYQSHKLKGTRQRPHSW